METAIDKRIVERAIDLKASLSKLRTLLNVDGATNVPQWCKDRMQELEEHLKEEKFIRSKQEESYDALSKYNKELTGQIEQLTKSRDALEEKLHRSEDAVHLEKKLLENKEKKWREDYQKLELLDSQKQAKIETLTARNAYYKKENEVFKDDHRKVREIQKEMNQLKETMKQKEAENESLKQEITAKQAANEEKYNGEVQKRETLEKKLKDTEVSLNQELKETKEKLEKLQEETSTAAKSLASFLKVIEETFADAEDADSDNDTVDLTLESNVFKIGVAIENLQSIVADAQDETATLKQELEETKKFEESQGKLKNLQEDAEIQPQRLPGAAANANGDGDQRSYESRDEHDEEDEEMEAEDGERPDASDNDEDDEPEPTDRAQPDALQNDYESDDSDIVEVQPAKEGNQPQDEELPDGDDDDSDIVEVLPQVTKPAKRPLEEDEQENARGDLEGEEDEVAPTAKRAKVDEETDGEGSDKSVTFGIDGGKEDEPEVQAVDTNSKEEETEEAEEEAPSAKRAKTDEDTDSDGSGYGSF